MYLSLQLLVMEEIVIKLDMPKELAGVLKPSLEKALEEFTRRLRFALIENITSKSKLTDEQADRLAGELKEKVAKRHGL